MHSEINSREQMGPNNSNNTPVLDANHGHCDDICVTRKKGSSLQITVSLRMLTGFVSFFCGTGAAVSGLSK